MTWEWFSTGVCAASLAGLIVTLGTVIQVAIGVVYPRLSAGQVGA